MILRVHSYQCGCGWSGKWINGGMRRVSSLIELVENQLFGAEAPQVKSVWRSIYQQLLTGKISEEDVAYKIGLVICSNCKTSQEQVAIYASENGSPIHPILCIHCGLEAKIFHQPELITCPACMEVVSEGQPPSSEEILKIMLTQCKVTILVNSIADVMLLVVGTRAVSYINCIIQDINLPLITIKKNESLVNGFGLDYFEKLRNVRRVLLLTSPESGFEADITMQFFKYLFNQTEVIPIITIPPAFEGKKSLERTVNHLNELQKYAKKTIVISGSALEKQYGASLALYKEHIPLQLKEVISLCD